MLLAVLGLATYLPSLDYPFQHDDYLSVVNNPHIRQLWPPGELLKSPSASPVSGRPVVTFTLAVNYFFGELDVRGYRAVNIALHILTSWVLYGLLARTFVRSSFTEGAARNLALAVTAVWVVHPLHTETVVYISQRTELAVGLFFLLAMYAALRAWDGPRHRWWYAAAIVFCLLGMASKEVMYAVPLLVMLYDRAFLAGSWREALRRRWHLYLLMATTWIVLAWLSVHDPRAPGFDWGMPAIEYLKLQPDMILHYLRLTFWPQGFCVYYGPWSRELLPWKDVALPFAVMASLVVVTAWACVARPKLGFLGAWFFLILAPSSSFVPLVTQVGAERRMYLSLVAVIVLVFLTLYDVGKRLERRGLFDERFRRLLGRGAAWALCAALVVVLSLVSANRARAFRSPLALWEEAVNTRPNAISHLWYGVAFGQSGNLPSAVQQFQKAIELDPDLAQAYSNMGAALLLMEKPEEAVTYLQIALAKKPAFADAANNLAEAYLRSGRFDEAITQANRAIELQPALPHPRRILAEALRRKQEQARQELP